MFKKTKQKLLVSCMAAIVTVSSSFIPLDVKAETTDVSSPVTRLGGNDRYETAALIAQEGWTGITDNVVLAAGMDNNLVDALAAGPLAAKLKAPVILTDEGQTLNSFAKEELQRLQPKKVYITSGTALIKPAVLEQIKSMGITPIQLGGEDRYETAVNIAKEMEKQGVQITDIMLAAGWVSPADALSVSSIAAGQGIPILSTTRDELPASVKTYLNSIKANVANSYVIGGTGVVSDQVKAQLPGKVSRYAGLSRYETNIEVLKNFTKLYKNQKIFIANGESLVDALAGAPLAAVDQAPIVLVNRQLTNVLKDFVKLNLSTRNMVALGGEAAVPAAVTNTLSSSVNYRTDGAAVGAADAGNLLEIPENITIEGNDITLKNAKADYSVFVKGNNVTLSNLKVSGTIFIDPGDSGIATLDGVTAANIVVLSGASESIHLNNSTSNVLTVDSSSNVHIVATGTTNIGGAVVRSFAIIDSNGGSLGEVAISSTPGESPVVELRGTFTEPILVESDVTLKAAAGAVVSSVVINRDSSRQQVTLDGAFQAVDVQSPGTLNLATNTIVNSVTTAAKTEIFVPAGSSIVSVVDTASSGSTYSGGGTVNGQRASSTPTSVPTSSSNNGSSSGGSSGGGSGGTSSIGSMTITSAGTYGPASGTTTVNGNVTVNVAGVTLRNYLITGDLIFGTGIGSGDAYINNVTVQGKTTVNGGGSHSIHIQGASTLGVVEVDDQRTDQSEPINIEAEGTGSIEAVSIKNATAVKVTPVTDTIGYVVAADGIAVTYGGDAANQNALFDKIVAKANSILDGVISGTTDSDIHLNNLSSLTAGVIDTSQYGIWSLKYYVNPLDGVSGYQNQYNTLIAKLQQKGNDTDFIQMRDDSSKFNTSYLTDLLPGGHGPELGPNQGWVNQKWELYNRYLVYRHYEVNGSGTVVASAGNTDDTTTQNNFIATAQTLYDNFKTSQNYSAVANAMVIDTDNNGLDAGDKVEITFKRRLKPGDGATGQDAITSLITANTPEFGTGASVSWDDTATVSFYGTTFNISKCTITLGTGSYTGLLGGSLVIPKDKFGSYIPDGFVEIGGQYGAYITNQQPLFDITVGIPATAIVPHVPALNPTLTRANKRAGNTGINIERGDSIEIGFDCKLAQASIDSIINWVNGNDAFGIGTEPGAKYAFDENDPSVTKLFIQFGSSPAIQLGGTFNISKDLIYDPTGLKPANDITITIPNNFVQ